jgi:hypothetical protein
LRDRCETLRPVVIHPNQEFAIGPSGQIHRE